MKEILVIIIVALSLIGCGSIDSYEENQADTQVSFSEYNNETDNYLTQKANLKVVQTSLVSGNTLLYTAQGSSSRLGMGKNNFNVIYPLWINESEVEEVEFAINKYRQWTKEINPDEYQAVQPINEYISEWMHGVTFKFGLYNSKQGKPFLSVCYEFSESGSCTFTYMIDKQNVDLLSEDLQRFKQDSFELEG